MSESDSIVPAGFRVIPGHPRYAINEHGNVISICGRGSGWRKNKSWTNAIRLACIKDKDGYHRVSLNRDGRSQQNLYML